MMILREPKTPGGTPILEYRPTTFPDAAGWLWMVPVGLLVLTIGWWGPAVGMDAKVFPMALRVFLATPLVTVPLYMLLTNRTEPWLRDRARRIAQQRGHQLVIRT